MLRFLDRARKVLVEWIQDVTELLYTSDGEEQQKIMAARILDLSLSCYATFDIDECHLASIFSSAQNAFWKVDCNVSFVHPFHTQIPASIFNHRGKTSTNNHDCRSSPNDRWVFTQISTQGDRAGMTAHFNILDGDFLVNRVLLTRLPRPYESHATYHCIFGGRILEVVPSPNGRHDVRVPPRDIWISSSLPSSWLGTHHSCLQRWVGL